MPKINEYDALTGQNTETEISAKAFADLYGQTIRSKSISEISLENAAAKTALLERLGITAEEAAILLS